MNNKAIISVVVVIILILAGVFVLITGQEGNGDDSPNRNPNGDQVSDNGEDDSLRGYQVYNNDSLGFEILYPEDANAEVETTNRIKFTFLGPENETGTEITDGFTLTVFRDANASEFDSLRAYAESRVSDQEEILRNLEAENVNNMNAYSYEYRSLQGGAITEYVFRESDGDGYVVTYNISDLDNDDDYEAVVMNMIETLRFTEEELARFDSVELAMLDYKDVGEESEGMERGCDRVVMVEREIESTVAPLSAALEELFSLNDTEVAGWNNFIAKTNDTLSFDRAVVENGTANIYLEGELSGVAGVCDNPRASIQIEETALQFGNVEDVQLYLNGEATDLTPSGRGE